MPAPTTLRINDIFWSFQGEGSRMGTPSIFVRTAGCSMHCSFCDSKDSWGTGIPMRVSKIMKMVLQYRQQFPLSQVVITGGEPMEQDLYPLVKALKEKLFFVAIETNGKHFDRIPIDWWTVSPKDVYQYGIHPALVTLLSEIKLVVNDKLSIEVIENLRAGVPLVPIFLQPDASDHNAYAQTFSLYNQCQQQEFHDIRCGIQMHKVYKVK